MKHLAPIAALALAAGLMAAPLLPAPEAAAAATLTVPPLPGANWRILPEASAIRFSGTHAGEPFQGRFERFDGALRFDPKDLANAKAIILVDTGSAKTGDKFQEANLVDGEWFDAKKQPLARFESQSFTAKGPGRYEMRGTLTIKGTPTPVTLPFELSESGALATAKGRTQLDRLALNLGRISDPKAEWVSRLIPLEIELKAQKQ